MKCCLFIFSILWSLLATASAGVSFSVVSSEPSTCVVGDTIVLTTASSGKKIEVATSMGPCIWEVQGGSGASIPAGLITFIVSGACPSGWSEVAALDGQAIYGTLAAHGDVGGAVGNSTVTPTVASMSLTAAAQTFTGLSANTNAVSAGTPAGTNSTSTVTPTGTIAWPAGVPTNASGAFLEGAISWPAGVPTNASGAFSEGAISWPAGVPTHSGTTASFSGNAVVAASTNSGTKLLTANTSSGVSPVTTATGTVSITSQGTIAWPAGVPTIAGGSFTNPTVSWPAGVPTIAGGSFTNPTVSWPAGVPTFSGGTNTVGAQTFSGSALGTHLHTLTATGTNGTSAVTGPISMNAITPQYSGIKAIFCSKD